MYWMIEWFHYGPEKKKKHVQCPHSASLAGGVYPWYQGWETDQENELKILSLLEPSCAKFF